MKQIIKDGLIHSRSPEDVIEQLANNRNRNQYIAQVYAENKDKFNKTIIFADRWKQCVQLCEFLRQRGIKAGTMFSHVYVTPTGRTFGSGEANAKTLENFRNGNIDVLVNIRMLTEGTDVPNVNTVFLTRQTTSRILLTQMIGRALRGTEFDGTPEAYIVPFVDDWNHKIIFAPYDQLDGGGLGEGNGGNGGKPLDLISIDLVRKLSRMMYDGKNVQIGPFLKSIPLGWYHTSFYSLSKGQDDYTEVNRLTLVFDDEKDRYENLMDKLGDIDLSQYKEEEIRFEDHENEIDKWSEQYFNNVDSIGDIENNIFYIACHMAQNDYEKPKFFPFEERDVHDMDNLVQSYMELNAIEVDEKLNNEYKREDRYWDTIYPSYGLFKQQFDACLNRILNLRRHKLSLTFTEPTHPGQGPSDPVKIQVKEKYPKCLGCGEEKKQILDVDHVNPRYMGGKDDIDNLQTLCMYCNTAKSTKEIDFRFETSSLPKPPEQIPDIVPPHKNVEKLEKWANYLHRLVNFFYCAGVVESIDISNPKVWKIKLHNGNSESWLKPHLWEITDRISNYRNDYGLKGPDEIKIV